MSDKLARPNPILVMKAAAFGWEKAGAPAFSKSEMLDAAADTSVLIECVKAFIGKFDKVDDKSLAEVASGRVHISLCNGIDAKALVELRAALSWFLQEQSR